MREAMEGMLEAGLKDTHPWVTKFSNALEKEVRKGTTNN